MTYFCIGNIYDTKFRKYLNVDTVQVCLTPTPDSSIFHFLGENHHYYQFLVSPSRDLMLTDTHKYLWK